MATYDDYDGVYFTVQAIRLYHPEITAETEIVVVDNHPGGPSSSALRELENWVAGYRYIPFDRVPGTAARDVVFREANADYVLCTDCHVLFAPGALRKLIEYFRSHPSTRDMLQGPLVYDDLRTLSTHMEPVWSAGMYGVWGCDARAGDPAAAPFEIRFHGLGVFACRKAAWPGLNVRLRGFGGEEGYLQEKFRRAGGRVLCLPFLRWLHRFNRPAGVPYRNSWEDRIRNYMIVADELGTDPEPALQHFRAHLGDNTTGKIAQAVRDEIASPFHFFDAIYCIRAPADDSRWQAVAARFERLGILQRVRRFEPDSSQAEYYARNALAHRAILAEAKAQALHNILVFEDDVLTTDAIAGLRTALEQLRGRPWRLLYLGACRWHEEFSPMDGLHGLARAGAVTCTHAIAYDASVYDEILRGVPTEGAAIRSWINRHHAIDQFLACTIVERKYLVWPVIATKQDILAMESAEVQHRVID